MSNAAPSSHSSDNQAVGVGDDTQRRASVGSAPPVPVKGASPQGTDRSRGDSAAPLSADSRVGSDSSTTAAPATATQQKGFSASAIRKSPSPSSSPKPENVPAVIQHLREVFTGISDTLISDAYRYGLMSGTIEAMYLSFYNRADRIVEQVIQRHGSEVYVRVMQENLMRLLAPEFEERTMQQVYYMCECCALYQDPVMLFTSLLSTDCLEQLIEFTDEMVRDQRAHRHANSRGRHGGGGAVAGAGAAANAEHGGGGGGAGWYGAAGRGGLPGSGAGVHNAPRHLRGGAGGGVVMAAAGTGAGAGAAMAASTFAGGASTGVGSPVIVDGHAMGMGPGSMPHVMNGSPSSFRGAIVEPDGAPRFAAAPRSPNAGTNISGSSYHSIPAPRGMAAGYVVRSEDNNASVLTGMTTTVTTMKQPLPRSATTLLQQQHQQTQPQPQPQQQQQQQQRQPAVGSGVVQTAQRADVQAPAAFLRDTNSGMARSTPNAPYPNVMPAPDVHKSPSPPSMTDRTQPPPVFMHQHHHHFNQASSPVPSMPRMTQSQPMESVSSGLSAPTSPPPSTMNRGTPNPTPGQARPMMVGAGISVHHHHHHLQMHRDPFMGAAPALQPPPSQPTLQPHPQSLPPQLPGGPASAPAARPLPGRDGSQNSTPVPHIASPQPPPPAGIPTSGVAAVAAVAVQSQTPAQPQPREVASPLPAARAAMMQRPHHHHHIHMHMHSSPGSPASPYQTTPLGVAAPADSTFSSSRVSSPPSTVTRETPSAAATAMPRHHHHHHHHLQMARPSSAGSGAPVVAGSPTGSASQRAPSSIDAGGDEDARESNTSWQGSPASTGPRAVNDPTAAAEEVKSFLLRGGVDPRTAASVAGLGCSLGELRGLPWIKTEHMLRLSGIGPSVYPLVRETLLGKEEGSPPVQQPSQLQQFLQRNNITGHSVSTASPNDSAGTPLGSASTQSLSQRDTGSARAPLQVPQPRTRQAGTNSATGSPLSPPDSSERVGSLSGTGGARVGWGPETSGDNAPLDGGRGRRGRMIGGRGRGGRGGGGDDVQVCKYYNKPEGCQFGSNCRYRHVDA